MNSPNDVKMLTHNKLPMLTPDHIDRRSLLKGVSLGAGAVVLQPFLSALAAEARGEAPPPRIVFVVEANGLWEHHIRPQTLGQVGGWYSPIDRLIDAPLEAGPHPCHHFSVAGVPHRWVTWGGDLPVEDPAWLAAAWPQGRVLCVD